MAKSNTPKSNKAKVNPVKRKSPISDSFLSPNGVRMLLFGILAFTFIVYLPVFSSEFVWDDTVYIQNNPLIQSFDLPAIFSTYLAGNYHPITVLGHTIEYHTYHNYHYI